MATTTYSVIESYDLSDYPILADAGMYDEEVLEVEVLATADISLHDYGVRNSPTWAELDAVEIEEIVINGKSHMYADVERQYGTKVAKYLERMALDRADIDMDWRE